jgi:hypothetical protein
VIATTATLIAAFYRIARVVLLNKVNEGGSMGLHRKPLPYNTIFLKGD